MRYNVDSRDLSGEKGAEEFGGIWRDLVVRVS